MSPVSIDPVGTSQATYPPPVAVAPTGTGNAGSVPFAVQLRTAITATTKGTGPASATGTTGTDGATGTTAITGDTVVATGKKYLGVPYVWGGTTTQGLDCSGLVQLTFKDLGIDLPRVSRDQAKVGTAVPSMDQARPGDLIAFGTPVNHIAIYVGDGKILEAPQPGQDVHITKIHRTPVAIRRIVAPGTGADAAATGTTHIDATHTSGAVVAAPELLSFWDPTSLANVPRAVPISSLGLASTSVDSTAVTTMFANAATAANPHALSAAQLTAAGLSSKVAAFADQFAAAEGEFSLPAGLLAAVAQAESGGDPNAVSPAGAQGLMQLMPGTARGLGVTDSFDPQQAIEGAAKLLSNNLQRYDGSVPLALAAYNAGPGAVAKYGGIPPYAETQQYVRTITDTLARLT